MPFTPAHAAAALPLLRTPLPASALILGSMTPDVPYYLPGRPSWSTHSLVGILTVDLALGLLLWALWHALLVAPCLDRAPAPVRARTSDAVVGLGHRCRSVRQVVLILAALVLGAASHVLWDGFTHEGRFGTRLVPLLTEEWGPLQGYRWAQYASGAVGVLAISGWVALWWRRTPPVPVDARPAFRRLGLIVPAAVAGIVAAVTSPSTRAAAFAGATVGGATAVLILVALAGLWHLRRYAMD